MNLREFYNEIGENLDEVVGRLGSEKMVEHFVKKFLADPSFAQLQQGLRDGDGEVAFRGVHTLKGVCQNLGFTKLAAVASELTEKLRGRVIDGSEELYEKVRGSYETVVSALKKLD